MVAALSLTLGAPSAAQSPKPATEVGESGAATCRQPNALAAVGCELAQALGQDLSGALVVSLEVEGLASTKSAPSAESPPKTSSGSLAERIARVTAGQLGAASGKTATSMTEAQLQARGRAQLVLLQPKLSAAKLEVVADVYQLATSFWDRVKEPTRAPRAHAFSSRPIDAEVQSFLPPVPLVVSQVHQAKSPDSQVQALACGDLDGDGALEIAVASRQQLHVGRIRDGRLQPWGKTRWSDLSSVSGSPLRQPITTLHLQPGTFLDAGSTDRSDWVRLSPQLQPLARRPSQLPWPGGGCAQRQGMGLKPHLVGCLDQRSVQQLPFSVEADAIAGAAYVTADGRWQQVIAARPIGQAYVQIQDGDGRRAQLTDAGAQLALADLNRDGVLDVISSSNTLDPAQDRVRVLSWQRDGLVEAFVLPVAEGVVALAACPPEGPEMAPVIVATKRELWVVR